MTSPIEFHCACRFRASDEFSVATLIEPCGYHAAELRKLTALRSRLKRAEKDVKLFAYLQNCPVVEAQAFFWNYKSRKQRAQAIEMAAKAALAGDE